MKNFIAIFIIISVFSCQEKKQLKTIILSDDPTTQGFIAAYGEAYKSLQEGKNEEYLNAFETIHSFAPNDPEMTMQYAAAQLKCGNNEFALRLLETVNGYESPYTNQWLTVKYKDEFQNLSQFNDLVKTTESFLPPLITSTIEYTLEEKGIIPEGVAYDKNSKTLFISSIYKRKIIAIDSTGKIKDFIPSGYEGISGVIGMEVDPLRNHLWACSAWNNMQKTSADISPYSGIYKLDLKTGKIIKKYILKDTTDRLINDVTISSNGTAFITESLKGKVYMIQPEADSLELFIDSDHYYYANGITLSDDEKKLYVAHLSGIDIIDMETMQIKRLKQNYGITAGRIDGLAYYKNSLIAHQATNLNGVYRYYLNQQKDSIIKKEIIDRNHPLFEFPTTGEIAGDYYFYIANAQLRRFDENGVIFQNEKLDSIYILKTTLKN